MSRQVIDGKVYDTKTAEEIGDVHGGGESVTDFSHWHGTLYKTKKGRYFIDGVGGSMTMFARSCGDNSTSGSGGIIALDGKRALAMAEARLDADVIEKFFDVEDA